MKKIVVLIPCYNEEQGIGNVLKSIPMKKLRKLGFTIEAVVIDNNSSDKTVEVAKKYGATILSERKQGKGNAIKTGFMSITPDTDYVVMLDGDDTYKSNEIPRLIEPLDSGFCDVIVGSRLGGKIIDGSFKIQNRIVNWGYAFLVRSLYMANITDVLSGFFAWKREALDGLKLHLQADGFAIEMEMITKMMKLGYRIYSVPITYDVRQGETKISALKDGIRILTMCFKNLRWTPSANKKQKFSFKIGMW